MKKTWRDSLPVHPAADLFPLMSEAELRELGEDIKKNGLQTPIVKWTDQDGKDYLLDGRNRLDALVKMGGEDKAAEQFLFHATEVSDVDPYAYVISANIHRRHLTAEQKRDLIEKLLKAKPEASDRAIAEQTKRDHKTVGKARAELERRGEIPHVEKRTDTKGRKQPSAKPKPTTALLNGNQIDVSKLGPKAQAAIAAHTEVAPNPTTIGPTVEASSGDFDLKKEIVRLAQHQYDIQMQMVALIKQANLTPALAREIKQLLDDFYDKHLIDENEYSIVDDIVRKDDDRKRFTKEAKNPQKALDGERERQQREEMEGDRSEAKRKSPRERRKLVRHRRGVGS